MKYFVHQIPVEAFCIVIVLCFRDCGLSVLNGFRFLPLMA